MFSSKPRGVRDVILSAGLPMMILGMILSATLVLLMGFLSLIRHFGTDRFPVVLGNVVWIFVWVMIATAMIGVLSYFVLGRLSRRLVEPIERLERDLQRVMTETGTNVLPTDLPIAELSCFAESFNKLQEGRRRQEQEIKNLTRVVLHDLRTPVANIFTACDQLAHGFVGKDEAVAVIQKSSRSMITVIDLIAEISKNNSGQVDGASEDVDVSDVVRSTIEMYSAVSEVRNIRLEWTGLGSPARVKGYGAKLREVVINLLDNAMKFTPDGGRVSLALSSGEGKVSLEVSDSGPGVCEAEREKIFERFFRSDATKNTPGTGLGLSLVKSIVVLHKGTIVCGKSDFGGACFKVSFPAIL